MSWFDPVQAGQAPGRKEGFGVLHHPAHGRRLEGGGDEGEIEGQMQFVVAVAVVGGQGVHLDRGLADEDPGRVVAVGQFPPAPQDVVDLGSVPVVDRFLSEELDVEVVVLVGRRVVPQLGVLDDDVAHVDPEPGHAPVEPEVEDGVEGPP